MMIKTTLLSTISRRAALVVASSHNGRYAVASVLPSFRWMSKSSPPQKKDPTSFANQFPHDERELQGGLNAEQLTVLQDMFTKVDNLEAQVATLQARVDDLRAEAFAVDSPDGDSDGHALEEQLEVQHIIQEAAAHEDKQAVEKAHKLEKEVKKFHARDPEHDW